MISISVVRAYFQWLWVLFVLQCLRRTTWTVTLTVQGRLPWWSRREPGCLRWTGSSPTSPSREPSTVVRYPYSLNLEKSHILTSYKCYLPEVLGKKSCNLCNVCISTKKSVYSLVNRVYPDQTALASQDSAVWF